MVELERTIGAAVASTMAGAGETTGADGSADDELLAAGERLGRYVIVGVLGQGGMGVVYAGYDPELDRKVALKLLYRGATGAEARMRTLREAQAMARLQHPNVVTIHDVGTADERVWLAMEHVEGVTLRQWLKQAARGWRPVLEVMRAAARGLAAAHAAGLVHRDVKPENIMIGEDGRVRVMDFGLARAGDAAAPPLRAVSGSSMLRSDLTLAGSLLGTPAYMAPEVLFGASGDVRADVFSWCVTCWEAVYGERPFAGETIEQLRKNVGASKLRAARAGVELPGELRRALERGLAALPAERYASFEQILVAVDAALRRRRRRMAAGAGLAAACVVAAGFGGRALQAQATADRCVAAGAEVSAVWREEAALRARAAFVASGQANAGDVFERTRPWLDAYATSWGEAKARLCLAEARGEAVADGLACLDERLAGFAVIVDEVFAEVDAGTLTRAVAAASRLPAPAQCLDAGWLAHAPRQPEDPTVRARISGVRAQIERSAALERASKYDEASALAEAALVEAEAIGWAPLVAQARLRGASLRSMRGEYAAAEAALEEVMWQAEAAGYDTLVAEAAHRLTFTVGVGLGRPAEAVRWGRLGLAVLRRLGEEDAPAASDNYASLGIVEESRGDLDQAQVFKEKALALRERYLGPDHPSVANALNMMGVLYMMRGDLERSLRTHERALKIRVAAFGELHHEVASSQVNLGETLRLRGESARCIESVQAAQRTLAAILGPGHPDIGSALIIQAGCEKDLGDLEGALRDHRAALAIRVKAQGAGHPVVAASWAGIGEVLLLQKDPAGAIAAFTTALGIFEAVYGQDDPQLVEVLVALAVTHAAVGAYGPALAVIERADGIRRTHTLPPRGVAKVLGERVRVLWDSGDAANRARARELAGAATTALQAAGPLDANDAIRDLRAWFTAHADELRG